MFERRIAQDEEAVAEVTSELEAMKETADKLDKLGKLAANPAMEQRLCSNYPFARVAEARVALGQWRAVEEKRAALQSSMGRGAGVRAGVLCAALAAAGGPLGRARSRACVACAEAA